MMPLKRTRRNPANFPIDHATCQGNSADASRLQRAIQEHPARFSINYCVYWSMAMKKIIRSGHLECAKTFLAHQPEEIRKYLNVTSPDLLRKAIRLNQSEIFKLLFQRLAARPGRDYTMNLMLSLLTTAIENPPSSAVLEIVAFLMDGYITRPSRFLELIEISDKFMIFLEKLVDNLRTSELVIICRNLIGGSGPWRSLDVIEGNSMFMTRIRWKMLHLACPFCHQFSLTKTPIGSITQMLAKKDRMLHAVWQLGLYDSPTNMFGHVIYWLRQYTHHTENQKRPRMTLGKLLRTPKSLKSLSRLVVVRAMGPGYMRKFPRLGHLPPPVLECLTFGEL